MQRGGYFKFGGRNQSIGLNRYYLTERQRINISKIRDLNTSM